MKSMVCPEKATNASTNYPVLFKSIRCQKDLSYVKIQLADWTAPRSFLFPTPSCYLAGGKATIWVLLFDKPVHNAGDVR